MLFGRHKAVARGAVLYHVDRCVTTRICTTSYGTDAYDDYDPNNPLHAERQDLREQFLLSGSVIGPQFSCLAEKVLLSFVIGNISYEF